ncbi:CASP-like protein 4D1 [Miscanthus floridulus]|uniref:CASP-like protein 4D1 n=1 Tax=Miscanthus floridulus TaxID=154761 RepID=UPI00345B4A9F
MALSRKAWIAAGMGARLLMIAVLAVSVPLTVHNHTKRDYGVDYYKLQSYTYTVAVAVIAMAGGVLQIPVAVYLLCKSKRMTPSSLILDFSVCADVVVTVLLASGVGAGFGATNDILRFVRSRYVRWEDNSVKDDLEDYYNKAFVPLVFILLGMVLSMAATVVSARLRARATDDADADV